MLKFSFENVLKANCDNAQFALSPDTSIFKNDFRNSSVNSNKDLTQTKN